MGASQTSLLIRSDHMPAEVAHRAAAIALNLRGEEATGADVVETLSNAIAIAIFSATRDPSDGKMVREIARWVSANITERVGQMCLTTDRIAG